MYVCPSVCLSVFFLFLFLSFCTAHFAHRAPLPGTGPPPGQSPPPRAPPRSPRPQATRLCTRIAAAHLQENRWKHFEKNRLEKMAQSREVATAGWRTTSPKKGTVHANDFTVEVDDNDKTTAVLNMEHCRRKAQIKRELARNVIRGEIDTVELETEILTSTHNSAASQRVCERSMCQKPIRLYCYN